MASQSGVRPPAVRGGWLTTRWRTIAGTVVTLAVLLAAGCGAMAIVGERAYRAAVARAGLNWRSDSLESMRPSVPDHANGATLVTRAAEPLPEDYWPRYQAAFGQLPPPDRALTPAEIRALGDLLRATGSRMTARQLAGRPSGRFASTVAVELANYDTPSLATRPVAALLTCDALDALERGDAEAFHVCWLALAHCAAAIGDEPTADGQRIRADIAHPLAALAERALEAGEWNEAVLAEWQRAAEALARHPATLIAARGWRGRVDSWLARRERSAASDSGQPVDRLLALVPGVMRYRRAATLDAFTEFVDIAGRPPREQPERFTRWLEQKSSALPATVRAALADWPEQLRALQSSQAECGCLVTALAAERFRHREGRWPKDLPELVASGLLPVVPNDPFTEGPVQMRTLANGSVSFLSVGPGGRAEGGSSVRLKLPRDRRTSSRPAS